jgi:hypothetical protein
VSKVSAEALKPIEEITEKVFKKLIDKEHLENYQSMPENSIRKSN